MIDVNIKDGSMQTEKLYPRLMRLKKDHNTIVYFEDHETGYQLWGVIILIGIWENSRILPAPLS